MTSSRSQARKILLFLLFMSILLLLTGCDLVPLHMRQQPYYRPLTASTLFEDGASSRPLPANTVPRGEWGELMLNEVLYTHGLAETPWGGIKRSGTGKTGR